MSLRLYIDDRTLKSNALYIKRNRFSSIYKRMVLFLWLRWMREIHQAIEGIEGKVYCGGIGLAISGHLELVTTFPRRFTKSVTVDCRLSTSTVSNLSAAVLQVVCCCPWPGQGAGCPTCLMQSRRCCRVVSQTRR